MAVNDSKDLEMAYHNSRCHRRNTRGYLRFTDCFILYKLINMLRGKTKFKCDACGNVFESFDIEDNATAGTMPVRCPKCGAQCLPKRGGWLSGLLGL